MDPTDIMFYATSYVTLFISIFWFTVYFSSPETRKRQNYNPWISIIVPAYNEEKHIGKCLSSLTEQNYRKLKIIVVDDGSTDDTGKIVRDFRRSNKGIKYIRTRHIGKAAALNTALKKVDTEVFGFIDSDTYLSAGTLRNMVGYFTNNTAAVTGCIKPSSASNFIQNIQKVEYMISSFTRKLLSYFNSVYFTPGFALYKTEVIKNLGGFDEHNLTEDLEIGMRLKKNGHEIQNTIESYAYTEVPSTFGELFHQRMRWYRGYIHNTKKYKHMFFNRKFSDLGIMVLPAQYILLALITPFLLYTLYVYFTSAIRGVIDMYLVGFDISYFFTTANVYLVTPMTFFFVTALALFVAMLRLSQIETKEKVGKLTYAAYVVIYPFLNTFLWISAFIFEILRVKKRW